jgi:ABC-type Fe3+ transport system substrate-binding protein
MLQLARTISIVYLVIALLLTGFGLVVTPVGSAPLQISPIGPAGQPIEVRIAYGTEKREWLEESLRRFEESNPRVRGRPIAITLEGVGSREMVTRIVNENYQPTVVSPASLIQVELLRDQWQRQNGANILYDGADAPQPLVLTPIVIVAWEERAQALWTNGPDDFWRNLQRVLADDQGWAAAGQPDWGFVNFGHTSPETSNSGLQFLVLTAYGYHDKARDLAAGDVLDPAYQDWVRGIERSVPEFGRSTGLLMTEMLQFGPSKYDMVAVYENLAIENFQTAEGRGGPLRVYYPPANIYSEHPYVVLNADWVTPEQREAAALFRDFLLSEEIQELALYSHGFRPANLQVPIDLNDSNNPFNRYADRGIRFDLPQQVEVPNADVLEILVEFWRREIRP